MRSQGICVALTGLAATILAIATSPVRAAPQESRREAVLAAIARTGGKVTIDERDPAKPVIKVELSGPTVTDATVEGLECLAELRSLKLEYTLLTDAGLSKIAGLKTLRALELSWNEKTTDAGLTHVEGLAELRSLTLEGNTITDRGLAHLKGLTQLRSLCLLGSELGNTGLKQITA